MGNNLNEISKEYHERVVLAGVLDTSKRSSENEIENSIAELALLAKTAGAVVVGAVIQRRRGIDNATFVGKGKLEEIRNACEQLDAEVIIFDDELSGSQIRNIEEATGRKVIDRSLLILDIFAQRAQSKEGKLQVELAQQKYRYSRLIGFGVSLSRLGGGIGTRGPGESKLETDRRHIKRRIDFLKDSLAQVSERRDRIREKRRESDSITIAVVGYTNAGKSTLINRLCQSDLYVENMLFATLDSAARKLILPDGLNAILVDTVGFIRKLPHHLIDAFKSTLEELSSADMILHVVDSSDNDLKRHMEIVEDLLTQLNASSKPRITVFNKIDTIDGGGSSSFYEHLGHSDASLIEDDTQITQKSQDDSNSIPIMFLSNETVEDNDKQDDMDDNSESNLTSENLEKSDASNDNEEQFDDNSDNEELLNDNSDNEEDSYDNSENAVLTGRSYDINLDNFKVDEGEILHVSAATGDGIDSLIEVIAQNVRNVRSCVNIIVPYKDAGILDFIRKNGSLEKLEYLDDGIHAIVRLPSSKLAHINNYVVK